MNPQVNVQLIQPTWYEYLTIAALIIGPVLALLTQRVLDWIREGENTKKKLYFTLMSTRFMVNTPEHVQALNSIDVVFDKDENIRNLWRKCMAHLMTDETTPGWQDTLDTLRVDLYQAIGNKLGYNYTTEYIKKGIYFPTRHLNTLSYQARLLEGLAAAVDGGLLKVKLAEEPPAQPPTPPVRFGGRIGS